MIFITTADKEGCVVIMNTDDYKEKMEGLFADSNTYTKQPRDQSERETEKLNKEPEVS